MSRDVTGLRKRLASFKPMNSSPVPELRVMHGEDDHGGDEHGDEEIILEEAYSETMSQSFSSVSSHSSQSVGNEHEAADDGVDVSSRSVKVDDPATASEGNHFQTQMGMAYKHIPRVSTNLPRSSSRAQRRGGTSSSRDVKHARDIVSSSTSSWLGYDLSIVVALVSPVGNLLTGSDHIKNILLLLLLIYYLHQLVEVPWTLYRMSIPSGEFLTPTPKDGNPVKLAAHAQLRALELFYLILTVLSPFLGATLLRYVAISISGNPATLSWFSTSLFVLATGVRPWTHLTERLKDRSRALTALLEESNEDKESAPHGEDRDAEIDGELSDLHGKFDLLDKRLTDRTASSSHELDDLADAIDAIETTVRRYQAEAAKKSQICEARLSVLETYVLDLHRKDGQTRVHSNGSYLRGEHLRAMLWDAVALPWTIAVVARAFACKGIRGILPSSTHTGRNKHVTPSQLTYQVHALETIVEEDLDSQEQAPQSNLFANNSDRRLSAETIQYRRDIVDLVATIALRLFAFVFSPAVFALRMMLLVFNYPKTLLCVTVQ